MKITISEMYCTKCGKQGISIPRKAGKEREAGHLKRIYCPHCKKETNHVEVRPFGNYNKDDFLIEFQNGNFVNGERVVKSYKQFISSIIANTEK